MTREEVYRLINGERDYQDLVWRDNAGLTGEPVRTVAEELLMLEEYVARARAVWTDAPREIEVRVTNNIIRKIAAIAVRCMEKHGAPSR